MNHTILAPLQALLQERQYPEVIKESDLLLSTLPPHNELLIDVHELAGEACEKINDHAQASQHFLAGAWPGGPKASQLWRRAGFSLSCTGDDFAATQAYYHALALNPGDHRAANNLLGIQHRCKRFAAVSELARYLGQQGIASNFLARAALVLKKSGKKKDAYRAYRKALNLAPEDLALTREMFYLALALCDFDMQDILRPRMLHHVNMQDTALHEDALQNVRWLMDEARNLQMAVLTINRKRGDRRPLFDHTGHIFGPRLRVGYVSADFKQHAVLTAMIGFFEQHDRKRFEVFAYSNSKPDKSALRQRFLHCVDHYVSIRDMSDEEAARRIYADNIDILVDLQGHTTHTRLPLFEHIPAPVQVAWMGYPGSSGSHALHYILSDAIVTPDSSKPHYTEKLCRLPETFFCTDNTRPRCRTPITRAAEGLPQDGLVFCCFNNAYKLDKETFALWMEVLRDLPQSVLWIREPDDVTKDFLHQTMRKHDVDPQRLIFARRAKEMEHHLARLALADLGLDTRVYNGHSMTADTLWAGVPVVTLRGEHFASRVAESLLRAVGLETLVAESPQELRDLILRLGRNPEELRTLRAKLWHNLVRKPLFDTERLTRHVENALTMMVERAAAGLPPCHMDVPALPPRPLPFMDSLPVVDYTPPELVAAAPVSLEEDPPVMRYDFGICPLCASRANTVVHEGTLTLPPDTEDFPHTARWLQCQRCRHVYATWQYTPVGRACLYALLSKNSSDICSDISHTAMLAQQHRATSVVREALSTLGREWGHDDAKNSPVRWLEVDARNDWTARMALDMGFAVVLHSQPQGHGCESVLSAWKGEGLERDTEDFICARRAPLSCTVIHLDQVLERIPYPALWLARAARLLVAGGVLLITVTQLYPSLARLATLGSPLLSDPERLHLFTLNGVRELVQTCFSKVRCMPLPSGHNDAQSCQWLFICQK